MDKVLDSVSIFEHFIIYEVILEIARIFLAENLNCGWENMVFENYGEFEIVFEVIGFCGGHDIHD